MKLLVIGHSVVDRIDYKGIEKVKPGGIHYTILALNSFAENEDEICLSTYLSKQTDYLFTPTYNQIIKKYISYIEQIPEVKLSIKKNEERDEKYSTIIENLNPPVELNYFDGILINMITGYDINLNQLRDIRRKFTGEIYFDVHTFSRGLDKNGKRKFRFIQDFALWAKNIDILQANEREMLTLSDKYQEAEIVREMFSYGLKMVIITKSESGVNAYLKESQEIQPISVPAIKIKTLNKVGCGDVFGAVFFYNYIRRKDIVTSLNIANIAAGISATYLNITDFNNLKNDVLQRYS